MSGSNRTCPLLTKHRISDGTCDFPEACTGTWCFWARWHEVDAHTGKPLPAASPQAELFQPIKPTPGAT